MAEIVPAVNVEAFEEVARRIRIVEGHARWVHIDVADGTFTPRAVWHNAPDLYGFKTPLAIEIHIMMADTDTKIDPWLATPAQRIIFHREATHDSKALIDKIHAAQKEAGVAIKPDTPWQELVPFIGSADLLQTLAVSPGPSGQSFDPATLEKLKQLRAQSGSCALEVDGGVRVGIARECKQAGANFIVVGSSLFEPEGVFAEKFGALAHDIEE